jgi:hypothetical protein
MASLKRTQHMLKHREQSNKKYDVSIFSLLPTPIKMDIIKQATKTGHMEYISRPVPKEHKQALHNVLFKAATLNNFSFVELCEDYLANEDDYIGYTRNIGAWQHAGEDEEMEFYNHLSYSPGFSLTSALANNGRVHIRDIGTNIYWNGELTQRDPCLRNYIE